MTDVDLEQRLRNTFQVMAERDIAPSPAPQQIDSPRTRRPLALVTAALAGVVVIAAIAFAVAYGPRNGHGPSVATAPPARPPVHTYIVASSPLGPAERSAVRATLLRRLDALGAQDPSVRAGRFPATHGKEGFEISAGGVSQDALRTVANTGTFFVRPVLCGAPPFYGGRPIAFPASSILSPCGAQYLTNQKNLDVTPSKSQGYNANDVPADPSLAYDASTVATDDYPGADVLLPADGSSYPRVVLGPAEMNSSDIAGATTAFMKYSGWFIDVHLTPAGARALDAVGAENFHQFMALDLDGRVISAPLIEPTNSTFTSFDGKLEIAGNFSAAQARAIAAVISSGPLLVQVTPPTTTTPTTTTTTIPTAALPTVTIGRWTGRDPTSIYFSGDAGDVATGLTWSRWDATEAVGQGTRNELDCVPNCAQGTSTPYPVTITMTNAVNGKFTTILEQTSDGRGTTETFTEPYLGQGACTTSAQDSCAF